MRTQHAIHALLFTSVILVGSVAGQTPDDSSFVAETAQTADSTATRVPEMDEFVPVEVIAEMIHYETPRYPREAEQMGAQGLVWVKSLVTGDGSVREAVVYKTSGNRFLDQAAVDASYGCRFKPAIQGGNPVAMWVTYKVEFLLQGGGGGRSFVPSNDFQVDCRIDKKVFSIKNDSIVRTASLSAPLPGNYVTSIPEASGRQYGILVLREADKTRPGRLKATVLIDAGCTSGLKPGSTGTVWDYSTDKPEKLANVEVLDVQAFETLCSVTSLRRKKISARNRITFAVEPPGPVELIAQGERYRESGRHDYAWASFEAVRGLADSNAIVRARLDEYDSIGHMVNPPRTIEDLKAMQRRLPGMVAVAGAYIRLDNPKAARRVVGEILAVDSSNEGALELHNAMTAFEKCDLNLADLFFGAGDTTSIDRLPEMTVAEEPYVYFTPFAYYLTPEKEKRPADVVWVRALVSSKGRVLRAVLHKSCGLPELDYAAVESAFKCQFKPGVSCGQTVATWVKWKVEFERRAVKSITDYIKSK